MNQILNNFNNNNFNISSDYSSDYSKEILKKKNFFNLVFIISIIICIIIILIYFFIRYNIEEKEKISKSLVDNFKISTLYSNTISESQQENISATRLSNDINLNTFVIGLIKIDKINLIYPILSNSTSEYLKIAPCKFYGPMPNQTGNLCIAGHNYVDNKLFSKIHTLSNNDIIQIYDLNGNVVDYIVYLKFEVNADDLSCTDQNTNNLKEITLVTCNNVNGNRTVIKARENI